MQAHHGVNSPSYKLNVLLLSLVWEVGNFLKGNCMAAFRKTRRGQRTISVSVDFQLPSAQSNPYAKVALFEGERILIPFTYIAQR